MRDILFLITDVFDVFVWTALVVAAVITAVRCGQKKLAPTAAWIMTVGFALGLVCNFGSAISNHLLVRTLGSTGYSVVLLLLDLVGVVGLVAVAGGVAMFSVRPSAVGQEAPHG